MSAQPIWLTPPPAERRRGYKESRRSREDKTHLRWTPETEWWPDADLAEALTRLRQTRPNAIKKYGLFAVFDMKPGDLAHLKTLACGVSAQTGSCESGHDVARRIPCGREWCPTCGAMNSHIHRQRIDRWMPKVRRMRYVCYVVIEARIGARQRLQSVEELRKDRKRVSRVLRRFGMDRGLERMHYFGSPSCPNGCRETVRSSKGDRKSRPALLQLAEGGIAWSCTHCGGAWAHKEVKPKYNPHFNLLLDSGYIAELGALKEAIAKAAPGWYLAHARYVDTLQPEEGYKDSEGKLIPGTGWETDHEGRPLDPKDKVRHWVHYITRATFLSETWLPELADELTEARFHTTRTWGGDKWDTEPLWGSDAPERGGCPVCAAKIAWKRVVSVDELGPDWTPLPDGLYVRDGPGKEVVP